HVIFLDKYIPLWVYKESAIRVRNHCGAEPPRDPGPSGLVTAIRRRDRASTSDAAAGGIEAPAGAARSRFRGVHGFRAAPSLPAQTGAAAGGGCLAGSLPA